MKKITYLSLIAILVLSSCSHRLEITKKYHSFGWNIAFENTKKSEGETKKESKTKKSLEVKTTEIEETIANVDVKENNVSENNSIETTKPTLSTIELKPEIVKVKKELSKITNNNKTLNAENVEIKTISKKDLKKSKRNLILDKNKTNTSDIIYILLILFVPFGTTISMYLYEGSWTSRVTTNLILTLLCYLPGLIHALITIFGRK